MKKIQVTTIEKMAHVPMIEFTPSFIARVIKLQTMLEPMIENSKKTKRELNSETGRYEDVIDANGNKEFTYSSIDGEYIAKHVMPFINELVAAFEIQFAQKVEIP